LITRFSGERGAFPIRAPTGEYDPGILCGACDSSFAPWEEYSAELLHKNAPPININTRKLGSTIPTYDYAALKLCLLSILWRMSVSEREVFERIALGRYEPLIRELLLRKDPGPPSELPIHIIRYTDPLGWLTMWEPERVKIKGVNFFTFGLPGYKIITKVDRKPFPFPAPVLGAGLMPDKALFMFLQPIDSGRSGEVLRRAFNNEFSSRRLMHKKHPR
jgi:hypothetical protein